MEFSKFPIKPEEYEKLKQRCPLNSYAVIELAELPIALPKSLMDKPSARWSL